MSELRPHCPADSPGPAAPETGALLARCTFPDPGSDLVCGVSGGPDSLALLVLAAGSGCRVTAVHVDHGLRPGSAAEAEVVAEAAQRFGARFESARVVVEDGPNLEARARHARREVLGPEAATGHTADDQAETVLGNLLRGAGVDGLAAMRPGPDTRCSLCGVPRPSTCAGAWASRRSTTRRTTTRGSSETGSATSWSPCAPPSPGGTSYRCWPARPGYWPATPTSSVRWPRWSTPGMPRRWRGHRRPWPGGACAAG